MNNCARLPPPRVTPAVWSAADAEAGEGNAADAMVAKPRPVPSYYAALKPAAEPVPPPAAAKRSAVVSVHAAVLK
jgi:hypothetical protein